MRKTAPCSAPSRRPPLLRPSPPSSPSSPSPLPHFIFITGDTSAATAAPPASTAAPLFISAASPPPIAVPAIFSGEHPSAQPPSAAIRRRTTGRRLHEHCSSSSALRPPCSSSTSASSPVAVSPPPLLHLLLRQAPVSAACSSQPNTAAPQPTPEFSTPPSSPTPSMPKPMIPPASSQSTASSHASAHLRAQISHQITVSCPSTIAQTVLHLLRFLPSAVGITATLTCLMEAWLGRFGSLVPTESEKSLMEHEYWIEKGRMGIRSEDWKDEKIRRDRRGHFHRGLREQNRKEIEPKLKGRNRRRRLKERN